MIVAYTKSNNDMDDQTKISGTTGSVARKSQLWKFFGGLVLIVVIVFIVVWGIGKYDLKRRQDGVQRLAEAMAQDEKDTLARMMASTEGGKTPQETLALYIAAVEKGDYVLASKYFIVSNQAKELESWKNVKNLPAGRVNEYIATLKSILTKTGQYSDDRKYFSFDSEIAIDFTLYPNGVWKISEI